MTAEAYFLIWDIMYVVTVIPIVGGNALIILSVIKFRRLRSNMHILIANLAISDFIVGGILIPYDFITYNYFDRENQYLCFVKLSLFVICLGSSCFNLMLISLERFMSITSPLTSNINLTTCKLSCLIAIGWTLSIINGCLPFFGWNKYGDNNTDCVSDTLWPSEYKNLMNWEMIAAFIGNIIMYTIVIRKALKRSWARTNLKGGLTVHAKLDKDLNHMLTMTIVLGLFIICWLPYMVAAVVVTFYETPVTQFIRRCTLVPGMFNSSINWLIYGYRNHDFRNAFRSLVTCRCVRRPGEESRFFSISFHRQDTRNGSRQMTTFA